MPDLTEGSIVWVALNPVRGSEHAGHRPAVVVSSNAYLQAVPNVLIVVPVTSRDRGFPHHIGLRGTHELPGQTFAMTEQPRTIDRQRITSVAGVVDDHTLAAIRTALGRFLGL